MATVLVRDEDAKNLRGDTSFLPSLCMRQKTSYPFEVPIHPDKRLYGQGNGVTLTTHVRVSQLLRPGAQFAIQLRHEPQRHRLTRTSVLVADGGP